MPYTLDNLPDNIKKLSATKRRQWMQVWNSAHSRCTSSGKDAKACESTAFAQANGVVLGGKSSNSAEFAASIATFELQAASAPLFDDGETIYRPGKLFVAGEYRDKDYAMTATEISAAAEAFTDPLPIDLEHIPTPLDGKLGELVSVEARGDELHGIVALPKWLDSALDERKVSATWDRATKTLAGLALVRNPRVSDAALMAAFAVDEIVREGLDLEAIRAIFATSRHDTPEGQQIMQELHNTSARGGAVCKASNTAKMASSHESSTIQKVHDMTTEHGAMCSSKKPGQPNWPYMFSRKEGFPVTNAWDWLKPKLEGEPAPEGTTTGTATTATMNVAESAEFKALKERTDRVEAENARIRGERIHDQAVAFADNEVRESRAYPAERDAIISEYVQRATDDMLHGTVSFGEGDQKKTTTRVDQMKALFAARPKHGLTHEQMTQQGLVALMNQSETEAKGQDKPADEKRVKDLVGMTAMGRAHNERKNGNQN